VLTDKEFLVLADLIGLMAKKVRVQCPRCREWLHQDGFCPNCAKSAKRHG
jgi:predicted amidophosphoribosyltransferase